MVDLAHILLIFLFAKVFGDIVERKNISPIVGQIVCGIVFGPFILEVIYPGKEIELLADIGLLVIMLYAGLTSDYRELLNAKYTAIVVGILGVLTSFTFGFIILRILGFNVISSLFASIILANTAVDIIGGLVTNQKNQKISHVLLGAAFFDDIIALYLIGLLSAITVHQSTVSLAEIGSVTVKIIVFFVITLLLSEFLISPRGSKFVKYLMSGDRHQLVMVIFIFALIFALFASFIGLHVVTGSFLAGLLISRIKEKEDPMLSFRIRFNELTSEVNTIMRFFFMPLFFVYLGLLFNRQSTAVNIYLIVLFFLGCMGGKIIGCGVGCKIFRFSNREALIVAVGMCGRGAMELALVRYGLSNGVISNELYSAMVMVILLSIIITPILFGRLVRRSNVNLDNVSVS